MVNEADLITRFNNFKHVHRDDTWRDMCHTIVLHLLELQMKVEEISKRSKEVEALPEPKEMNEVLKAIQAIPNDTKKSWFKKEKKGK